VSLCRNRLRRLSLPPGVAFGQLGIGPAPADLPATMQGLHLTADLFGCRDPAGLMHDGALLAALCEQEATAAGLCVVARQFHAFDAENPASGAGHTGVLLLAESHLAVHTWPELRAVTLDVFVCNYSGDNTHKAQQLIDALVPRFDASHVNRQQLARGLAP